MLLSQAEIVLTDVTFTQNTAIDGGAVRAEGIYSLSTTNVDFTNNTASNKGGGLYVSGSTAVEQSTATIANSTFSGNTGTMLPRCLKLSLNLSNSSLSWGGPLGQ